MSNIKYYVVRKGFKTGIFTELSEFKNAMLGFTGSEGKSFTDKDEAIFYLYGKNGIINKYLSDLEKSNNEQAEATQFASKAEEYVCTLIDIIIDIKESCDFNFKQINKLDKELQDLLHEIELSKFSTNRGSDLAKEIQNIRSKRRKLKDENETLNYLYEYFVYEHCVDGISCNKPFGQLLSELGEIKNKINKKQKELDNRVYIPKVRKDLTIPTKL